MCGRWWSGGGTDASRAARYLQAAVLALPAPGYVDTFVATLCFLVVMSQQFHSWSHSRKSQLPAAVNALQEASILVSRKSHGAHHRKPFASNYCIVSGLWNPILDQSNFFRWAETVVYERTGVEARCWSEPDYTWLTGLPAGKLRVHQAATRSAETDY